MYVYKVEQYNGKLWKANSELISLWEMHSRACLNNTFKYLYICTNIHMYICSECTYLDQVSIANGTQLKKS